MIGKPKRSVRHALAPAAAAFHRASTLAARSVAQWTARDRAGEIFDGDAPFTPRGCISQAWTVGELLRAWIAAAAAVGRNHVAT